MPFYFCIQCHFNEELTGHPPGGRRCSKCRYPLRYLGREIGEVSSGAYDAPGHSGDDAVVDRKGRVSKTLWARRPDPAVLEAETQLGYRPDDPGILSFLANHALAERDWARGIGFLKRFVSIVPGHRVAMLQLAEALLLDGRHRDAELVLAQYLSQVDDDPVAHYNMALAIGLSGGLVERIRVHADACDALTDDPDLKRSAWQLFVHFSEEKIDE